MDNKRYRYNGMQSSRMNAIYNAACMMTSRCCNSATRKIPSARSLLINKRQWIGEHGDQARGKRQAVDERMRRVKKVDQAAILGAVMQYRRALTARCRPYFCRRSRASARVISFFRPASCLRWGKQKRSRESHATPR